jgi:ketoreductase RED2
VSARVALVTGTSSGIGAAIARRLAAEAFLVCGNSREGSREAGERLAADIGGSHHTADVADEGQVSRMVDEVVARHGRIDLVVNNAGTGEVIPHADVQAVDAAVWQRILAANLVGPWLVVRAALPHLVHDGANVVNISSVTGSRPGGSSIPYAASKAGLDHMTRLLAAVLGPAVRVNAVAPGLIDTPRSADWDELRAVVQAMAPLRRSGTPEDVAEAVVALDRARYTTGEVVTVDGGVHLR